MCIDPQMQANIFIRKLGNHLKKENFVVLKYNDSKLSTELEYALKYGKYFLVENVSEEIPPLLDMILNPKIKMKGRSKIIV